MSLNDADPVRQHVAVGFRAARSVHGGGVNVGLGDGAVRPRQRQPSDVADLPTRAGKEIIVKY